MTWWLLGSAAAVLLLAVAAYAPIRDLGRSRRIALHHGDHRHDAAVQVPLPRGGHRPLAAIRQAGSAVVCGRYSKALDLLDSLETDARGGVDPTAHRNVRVVALLGMGRYGEAARMLGEAPLKGWPKRLQAQIAVETGDDARVRQLLADREPDAAGEAGRLRILGDLAVRRGDHDEAESLLKEALARYEQLPGDGHAIDQGYCLAHQAESRVRTGATAEAIELVHRGLTCMLARQHHAPGLAYLEAVAAEAYAGAGRHDEARGHLAHAITFAESCSGTPLLARVTSSAAEVARAARDLDGALAAYEKAIGLHESVGERPEADRLRERLATL